MTEAMLGGIIKSGSFRETAWLNETENEDENKKVVGKLERSMLDVLNKSKVTGNGKFGDKAKRASRHEKVCYYAITCKEHFYCFICDQAYKLGKPRLTHNFRKHPLQASHIRKVNALSGPGKKLHKYAHYWETSQQRQQQDPGADNKLRESEAMVDRKDEDDCEVAEKKEASKENGDRGRLEMEEVAEEGAVDGSEGEAAGENPEAAQPK